MSCLTEATLTVVPAGAMANMQVPPEDFPSMLERYDPAKVGTGLVFREGKRVPWLVCRFGGFIAVA